ncbi:MAG: hypothetical protein N2043_01800 [Ignavibacterium sp.]|nr:hypothetical protein [Ignavibacterium sp.]
MIHAQVKIERMDKTLPLPFSKYEDNAGWDVFCIEDIVLPPMKAIETENGLTFSSTPVKVPLNMKVAIPDGFFMKIVGRSGLSSKGLVTATGIVDAGYRGQVFATIYNLTDKEVKLEKGSRVAQAIILPYAKVEWIEEEVDENETLRGTNGFGSSGLK